MMIILFTVNDMTIRELTSREAYLRKGRDGSTTKLMKFVVVIFDLDRGVSNLCLENRESTEKENNCEEAIDACSVVVRLILFLRVGRIMSIKTG